eukprot:CAMPEP_0184741632 /NCGR_PEP_ID=MMETSP0315-20130426/4678_1 /TAXON_ID=101924 /ORGANISM="Rhodosorus marinus, Strain UTEX LB 2760" /LENGTH=301 /DNA_ID=CAMNT_0027212073 /DNA_START=69 /DNA_END=974 /DNA_ORIENTATION=+
MTLKVAYQGIPGAYSEGAAVEYFGEDALLIPCATFDLVFEKLLSREADRAALPFENSLAGTIYRNLDLLVANDDVHIVGEIDFRVRHCLMTKQDTDTSQVKQVFSHPMALAQCEGYMKDRGLVPVEGFDTAGSAQMLSDGELTENAGAIASRRTVDLYGLKLMEADIEDDEHNFTRFLILSLESAPRNVPGIGYKTSIAITLENKAGALCKALGIFSAVDLFMTKIESRHRRSFRGPSTTGNGDVEDKIWEYVFYIDIAADYNDPKTQTAVTLLQQITYVLPNTLISISTIEESRFKASFV